MREAPNRDEIREMLYLSDSEPDDTPIEALGPDWMTVVGRAMGAVFGAECRWGLSVDDDRLYGCETVGDLIEAILAAPPEPEGGP